MIFFGDGVRPSALLDAVKFGVGRVKIVHVCLKGALADGWNYQENILPKYHRMMGHEVTMITSQWIWGTNGELKKYEKSNYLNSDGVKIIRLSISGKDDFNRKFKKYAHLMMTLCEEQADILFVHAINFLDSKEIVKYCELNPETKLYVDSHVDFSNSAANWLSRTILHGLIWKHYAHRLLPHVRKFYGVLPARVDFLTEVYKLPKEKCELLVMGADDDRVLETKRTGAREKIRELFGVLEGDFLVMTGGKIDRWKKQTLLLMEAVAKIDNPSVVTLTHL